MDDPLGVREEQWGIAHEIERQPAVGEGFKFPILVPSRFEARGQFGLLVIRKNSDDRDKRVRMFRVIPAIFVSERNDEIAIARIFALTKSGRDSDFDTIYDLCLRRYVVL